MTTGVGRHDSRRESDNWEVIGETVSVGRPVGSVLPVAFWWRHSFYRITEVLQRRFMGGRKELTVTTESGVFKLEETGGRWVIVARCASGSDNQIHGESPAGL